VIRNPRFFSGKRLKVTVFFLLFVNWAAKFIDGQQNYLFGQQKIYFIGQQFYFFRTAKFINGQQLLKR
jgi:hypothetical protein